jgi:hypothetical protein
LAIGKLVKARLLVKLADLETYGRAKVYGSATDAARLGCLGDLVNNDPQLDFL